MSLKVNKEGSAGSTPAKQALPQTPFRSPSQIAAIVGLIVVVGIVIGALYLAQATVTATTGSELLQLLRTREFLQRANADTVAQIAQKRNISTLRGRAQELGFEPATSAEIQYIVVDGYTWPRATSTPAIEPTPSFVYDETFTGWVQQQWNALLRQFEQWMGRATPVP